MSLFFFQSFLTRCFSLSCLYIPIIKQQQQHQQQQQQQPLQAVLFLSLPGSVLRRLIKAVCDVLGEFEGNLKKNPSFSGGSLNSISHEGKDNERFVKFITPMQHRFRELVSLLYFINVLLLFFFVRGCVCVCCLCRSSVYVVT